MNKKNTKKATIIVALGAVAAAFGGGQAQAQSAMADVSVFEVELLESAEFRDLLAVTLDQDAVAILNELDLNTVTGSIMGRIVHDYMPMDAKNYRMIPQYGPVRNFDPATSTARVVYGSFLPDIGQIDFEAQPYKY